MLAWSHYLLEWQRGCGEVHPENRDSANNATIGNMSYFVFRCPKANTINMITERFFDNVTTIINDVNITFTKDEKIILLLSYHRIMKITTNVLIKCIEGRC